MLKFLQIIFAVICTSFYFFPFEFVFLPGINTKMAMAGVGLVLVCIDVVKKRDGLMNKDFLSLSIYALAVSFISLVTIILHSTYDHSFTTYFLSMWVWLAGAYMACRIIKAVHGYLSVELVATYLVVVCVAQCLLAYVMDMYTPLRMFVDSFLSREDAYMGVAEGRLYGIGCALDVAGLRFSSVLVIIAYLCQFGSGFVQRHISWYLVAFVIISVIGNMIARTTTVGMTVALAFWAVNAAVYSFRPGRQRWKFLKRFGVIMLVSLPAIIAGYNLSPAFAANIRFAFEGFFSLFETGEWYVQSNEILLNNMIVFPDNAGTWIIGDGYAANPVYNPEVDPYYTGEVTGGFYKGTDIGYLRYIFYFGLIGLLAFILFFCKAASICCRRYPEYTGMFLLILAINFIGWLKVSTDIFLVFAIFLAAGWYSSPEEDITEEEGESPESVDDGNGNLPQS